MLATQVVSLSPSYAIVAHRSWRQPGTALRIAVSPTRAVNVDLFSPPSGCTPQATPSVMPYRCSVLAVRFIATECLRVQPCRAARETTV